MNDRASAVIIHEEKILLTKRIKPEKEIYYTLPGGHIEKGEGPEQTVIRELQEECGIDIVIDRLFLQFDNLQVNRSEHIFLAHLTEGTDPNITWQEQSEPENIYVPTWISIVEAVTLPLLPPEAIEALRKEFFI